MNINQVNNNLPENESEDFHTANKNENVSNSHQKARTEKPDIYPERFAVPDDKVSWNVPYEDYSPDTFTAQVVLDHEGTWADPLNVSDVEREIVSYEGVVKYDDGGYPLNPRGRTGLKGRGLLGKWGPNFAADPIVTRVNPETKKVEALLIKRADSGEWAIPGGMVDTGEKVSATLSRELGEETGAKLLFEDADIIYKGYVDDPRNTDNAWMETTASHLHIEGERELNLKADSDAVNTKWVELTERNLSNLYASHGDFLRRAMENLHNKKINSTNLRF
jgi:ADP-ribose pyrophosphatase